MNTTTPLLTPYRAFLVLLAGLSFAAGCDATNPFVDSTRVCGTVLDEQTGTPVTDLSVALTFTGSGVPISIALASGFTDVDGKFCLDTDFDGPEPIHLEVNTAAWGEEGQLPYSSAYGSVWFNVDRERYQERTVRLEPTAPDPPVVTEACGTVVDEATGTPLGDLLAALIVDRGGEDVEAHNVAKTDRNGAFCVSLNYNPFAPMRLEINSNEQGTRGWYDDAYATYREAIAPGEQIERSVRLGRAPN